MVFYFACQHAHDPLLEVHDRVVAALVAVDNKVVVQPHHNVAAKLRALLEEADMTSVEQVKGTSHIHHFVTWLKIMQHVKIVVMDVPRWLYC